MDNKGATWMLTGVFPTNWGKPVPAINPLIASRTLESNCHRPTELSLSVENRCTSFRPLNHGAFSGMGYLIRSLFSNKSRICALLTHHTLIRDPENGIWLHQDHANPSCKAQPKHPIKRLHPKAVERMMVNRPRDSCLLCTLPMSSIVNGWALQ